MANSCPRSRILRLLAITLTAFLLTACRNGYVEVSDRKSYDSLGYVTGGQGSSPQNSSVQAGSQLIPDSPLTTGGSSAPETLLPQRTDSTRTTAAMTLPPETTASAVTTASAPSSTAPPPSTTRPAPSGSLTLLEFTRTVKKGNKATVTVQGTPNTKYTIKVKYSSGYSSAKGLEDQISDADGKCSWTWRVGASTKPGDYPVTISDGVNSYTLTLTVE